MIPSVTLPTTPLEHPAMDYAFLRQEGIRHLERLAGQVWTDFNAHDPGITILEQLCYALTDLAYRINYPLPDLLTRAGEPTYNSLYRPVQILTSQPVTLDDLRKLVIDVAEVKNAWVEPVEAQESPLYFYTDQNTLSLQNGSLTAEPVYLKGLYRVLVELFDPASPAMSEVVRRLHARRGLGEDYAEIQAFNFEQIRVWASIELDPAGEVEGVLLNIYQQLANHISPPVRFYTLSQLLAAGKPVAEIFEGPALEHGFIVTEELRQAQRRTALRTSDLIREIMAVPGVKAVKHICLSKGARWEDWSLKLESHLAPRLQLPNPKPGGNFNDSTYVYDPQYSYIVLYRNQLPVRVDYERVEQEFSQWLRQSTSIQLELNDRDIQPSPGRDRQVETYYSIQHQFPATYGLGELGLPKSASPQRQAQAQQLKAYLLFFEQLLANYLAQLAHVRDLFSFAGDSVTYFSQPITDSSLGLDEIYRLDAAGHKARLQQLAENPYASADSTLPPDLSRRQRFLNHLLARFAEQFTDYSLLLYEAQGQTDPAEKLIQAKQSFLQQFPQLSAGRGTAFDYLLPWSNNNSSGLEKRLRHKLGLQSEDEFFLVEHILLRPIAEDVMKEDESQQLPLLADPRFKDPYSLQLSFVFPKGSERFQQPGFPAFVERTIREETPAHLAVMVHWLDSKAMETFNEVYQEWLTKQRAYWLAKSQALVTSASTHLRARAARDRLIDLLGLGQTYPLQDLAVRDEQLTVVFNNVAYIPIEDSQKDVLYQLHYKHEGVKRISTGEPIQAQGNGGTISLETNPIREDITFEIYAQKSESSRSAYLYQTATVKVGLDVTLKAWIQDKPHLDSALDLSDSNKNDTAPRIINYGEEVGVVVEKSQEGVDYELVRFEPGKEAQALQKLSSTVRGNLGNITLTWGAAENDTEIELVKEDTDIGIRAIKEFDPSENRPTQTDLLKVILPLKVRANPDLAVTIDPGPIIDFNQSAVIKIAQTQKSAAYQLYLRPIPDEDFIRQSVPETEVIKVSVEGEPDVQVPKPSWGNIWTLPEGYMALGEVQPGTGGELRLALPPLARDNLVIVQARKEHQASLEAQAPLLPSAVQLKQAIAILVRPNPTQALRLEVILTGEETNGELAVFDGQPGVFYEFRADPTSNPLSKWPVYFHQRDEIDSTLNKGLEQLVIGVDYVIARSQPATLPGDLFHTPPASPIVETGPLAPATTLYIQAIKAQTRVKAALAKTALMAALPEIRPEEPIVDYNKDTRLLVIASVEGDRYQPFFNGEAFKQARLGNRDKLSFKTDTLTEDTFYQMRVSQTDQTQLSLTRIVNLPIIVRPNPNLTLTLVETSVEPGQSATLQLQASQMGVSYQLMALGDSPTPVGVPVAGNGETLLLPTGPLAATTIFGVRATKLSHAEAWVDLPQIVTVQVASGQDG